MSSKIIIGDILEIPTSIGFAYAQYTHQHPKFGGLIRVFDPIFSSRPANLNAITNESIRFSTFLPVAATVKKGIFKVVGRCEIAHRIKNFPVFRDGVVDPKTGKVAVWWLWDGTKEWRIGTLTPKQRNLPIRSIWNDTLLVQRIELGWMPATDQT